MLKRLTCTPVSYIYSDENNPTESNYIRTTLSTYVIHLNLQVHGPIQFQLMMVKVCRSPKWLAAFQVGYVL